MEDQETKHNLAYLERQLLNLSKLVDINSIINSTLDIGKLLTIIMEIIKDIMETETSTLLLLEEGSGDLVFKVALGSAGDELMEKYRVRMGQGIAGWVASNRKPLIVNDVYSDERFDPNFDKSTGFVTRAILCSPLLFKGKLLGVIQAINPVNRPQFTVEDQNLFKIFSDQAALAVQNAIFFQSALEEERIKGELVSARSIQETLVPSFNVTHGNFEIAARSLSAREVGGEFHGLYRLDDDKMAIAMGDIHEKGIPGGLRASTANGALKMLSGLKGHDPAALLQYIRNTAARDVDFVKRMSLFFGVIDRESGEMLFSNAGVTYPILVRDGIARYLRLGVMSIGDEEKEIKRIRLLLRPGDVFVVVTDGILNIRNRAGQVLGLKRIMEELQGKFTSSESIIDGLVRFSVDFSGGLERREDISILAVLAKQGPAA